MEYFCEVVIFTFHRETGFQKNEFVILFVLAGCSYVISLTGNPSCFRHHITLAGLAYIETWSNVKQTEAKHCTLQSDVVYIFLESHGFLLSTDAIIIAAETSRPHTRFIPRTALAIKKRLSSPRFELDAALLAITERGTRTEWEVTASLHFCPYKHTFNYKHVHVCMYVVVDLDFTYQWKIGGGWRDKRLLQQQQLFST